MSCFSQNKVVLNLNNRFPWPIPADPFNCASAIFCWPYKNNIADTKMLFSLSMPPRYVWVFFVTFDFLKILLKKEYKRGRMVGKKTKRTNYQSILFNTRSIFASDFPRYFALVLFKSMIVSPVHGMGSEFISALSAFETPFPLILCSDLQFLFPELVSSFRNVS